MPKSRRPKARKNPISIPGIDELFVWAEGGFTRHEVEDFVDYCMRALEGLPEHLQMRIEALWAQNGHDLWFVKGSVRAGDDWRGGDLAKPATISEGIRWTDLSNDDRDALESTGRWDYFESSSQPGEKLRMYRFADVPPWPTRRGRDLIENPVLDTAAHLATVAMAGSYFFGRGAKKNPGAITVERDEGEDVLTWEYVGTVDFDDIAQGGTHPHKVFKHFLMSIPRRKEQGRTTAWDVWVPRRTRRHVGYTNAQIAKWQKSCPHTFNDDAVELLEQAEATGSVRRHRNEPYTNPRPAPGGRRREDPHGLKGLSRGELEERLEQARASRRALLNNDMPADEVTDEIKELKALLADRGDA